MPWRWASSPRRSPIVLQLYVEPLQRFRSPREDMAHSCRRRRTGRGSKLISTRCRSGTRHSEEARIDPHTFPLHAITQRPMQMYHSWHSQKCLVAPDPRPEPPCSMNRVTARGLGLADDDWVWVSSHAGRGEAQLKLMDGVNPDTVWTWNAIGKRSGAWNLSPESPGIHPGLLAQPSDYGNAGRRRNGDSSANADPITGQAAWYDLRVRVEKALPARGRRERAGIRDLGRPPG